MLPVKPARSQREELIAIGGGIGLLLAGLAAAGWGVAVPLRFESIE